MFELNQDNSTQTFHPCLTTIREEAFGSMQYLQRFDRMVVDPIPHQDTGVSISHSVLYQRPARYVPSQAVGLSRDNKRRHRHSRDKDAGRDQGTSADQYAYTTQGNAYFTLLTSVAVGSQANVAYQAMTTTFSQGFNLHLIFQFLSGSATGFLDLDLSGIFTLGPLTYLPTSSLSTSTMVHHLIRDIYTYRSPCDHDNSHTTELANMSDALYDDDESDEAKLSARSQVGYECLEGQRHHPRREARRPKRFLCSSTSWDYHDQRHCRH